MTTAAKLRKYKTYLYDEKGKLVMLQLDLRNKRFREYVEEMIDDFEDSITALERDDDDTISMEEVEKRVLALQSK